MATNTGNYNWPKPSYEDDADIEVLNSTFDAIDAQVKANFDANQNLLTEDRAALAEIIDSGAKNELEIAQGKETTYHCTATVNNYSLSIVSTGNWARASYPITLKPGKYVFSCNVTEVTGSARVRFYTDSSGQGGTAIVSDLIISSSGIKSTEITLDAETTFYAIYYSNYSSDSTSSALIVSDNMICTEAAWDITQKFVPYRPSYDELIARIEALESL